MLNSDHTGNQDYQQKGSDSGVEPFGNMLSTHQIEFTRGHTHTLQVNVGLICNQVCRHCHLSAGPNKNEVMSRKTADIVAAYAGTCGFESVDITGGAPELNKDIIYIVNTLYPQAPQRIFRSNLTVLADGQHDDLIRTLIEFKTTLTASFPSLNETQADAQRGSGVFKESVEALRKLNSMGYGQEGSGLVLNLVSNPTGAFLAPSQEQTRKRFKQILHQKWGIVFNNLFNFSNVPLGRFRTWLEQSGNLNAYIQKLAGGFNPCAVQGVMCRTLMTVSWDGFLYDCDFNLARGLFMGRHKTHISEMTGRPEEGSSIITADHCYTCTAGSGFT